MNDIIYKVILILDGEEHYFYRRADAIRFCKDYIDEFSDFDGWDERDYKDAMYDIETADVVDGVLSIIEVEVQ